MHRRLVVSALAAVALVATTAAGVSAHSGNSADRAVSSVTRVAPPVQGEVQTRAVNTSDGSYAATSAHTATRAPGNSRGKVSIASLQSSKALTIGLPSEVAQTDAVLSSDGSVVYGSDSGASSTVVQTFTNGVRLSTTLASQDAGTSFTYPLVLQKGSRIEIQANGGVLIVGPGGAFMGGLLAPWARDNNGVSVPTHYEVQGDSIVQVIDGNPAALAYPVVADPYFFIDLIDHYTWALTYSYWGYTDQVYPTPWAIAMSGNWSVAEYGWEELVHKDPAHQNRLNDGMHQQYDCHQMLAAGLFKGSYNLDWYRYTVGLAQTILDRCNPPIIQ